MLQYLKNARTNPPGQIKSLLFFPITIFYLELILRLWSQRPFWSLGFLYMSLFAIGAGLICTMLTCIGPEKCRRIIGWVLLSFITLVFIIQLGFYSIFRGYVEFGALWLAGDVMSEFFLETLGSIAGAIFPGIMMLLPLVAFGLLGIWKKASFTKRGWVLAFAMVLALHMGAIGSIMVNTSGILPLRAIYRESFTLNLGVENFGLVTAMRLDLRYTLFGRPQLDLDEILSILEGDGEEDDNYPDYEEYPEDNPYAYKEEIEEPVFFGYNVLPIDFESLIYHETRGEILEMHQFFANRQPTARNEFTGMFEGKNLIWIVGEAFHHLAIHPIATPTLYRLSQEGFIFPNFYTPDTGFSTMGGEFATLTGLIPANRNSFPQTANNYMPFAFGNMFRERGYETFAWHNNTFTFNQRHHTHPNLGYTWVAMGNGLNIPHPWPASDFLMAQATVDNFIDLPHFHVYYLTVSGHLEYNFFGNAMAMQNRAYVEDLPYTTAGRAFLATQMELDRMLEYILYRFEAAGRLDDIVIVLSSDHYPYGLTIAEMEDLGATIDDPMIDVHHSPLIIWNNAMEEAIVVESFSSFYDIVPTLANLFNLPFDSRLLAGVDLLSDAQPFVPFASRSWISQYGRFNSRSGEFTHHEHISPYDIPENHPQMMQALFQLLEMQSERIVRHDYFRIVLGG